MIGTLCVVMLASAAEQPTLPSDYPKLYELDISKPHFAAYGAWHRAALKNDYETYRKLSYSPVAVPDSMALQIFQRYRVFAPDRVKIAEIEVLPKDAFSFTSIGCKDNRRYVSVVIVAKIDASWKVLGSEWGPPWNSSARVCPV